MCGAVITGSVFEEADLTDATFDDALIGYEDVKRLYDPPRTRHRLQTVMLRPSAAHHPCAMP